MGINTMRRMCLGCLIMKRMGIITRIHVYLFQWMDIDSKENGWKKSFSCKILEYVYGAKLQKKKDYFKSPCLSLLIDEYWI